ncbi:hypothetical protein AgCh_008800 [Apium graveolens]
MTVVEKIGIFIFIIAQGSSNRHAQERFQHSGETVSRVFHEVLHAVCLLARDLIKPDDPEFKEIPSHIRNDRRYMPHFKDCIGAIDGTHIHACVPVNDQVRFVGRKNLPTQNGMAACSFDMRFTYVLAGWEDIAHDARIFNAAINMPNSNFPSPPHGKYYLVDAGYPQSVKYVGPYKAVRYHLPEFRHGQPAQGYKEIFNKAHSSLRSCIERTFGVWKKRWMILSNMPSYWFGAQRNIVVAIMALHNYIRLNSTGDTIFNGIDANPDFVPRDIFPDHIPTSMDQSQTNNRTSEVDLLRNQIAASLMMA